MRYHPHEQDSEGQGERMDSSANSVMGRVLSIDPGAERVDGHCATCGHETRTFRGFVNDQQGAYAVYLGTYTASHPELGVEMAVSIGGWGAGNDPALKQCVALEFRASDAGAGWRVRDAGDSCWATIDMLGQMLPRAQVMESGIASEAFAIIDAVWRSDPRLAVAAGNAHG